jgi:pyruvate formate-lyase activating enzyme-like uncharacterized protein
MTLMGMLDACYICYISKMYKLIRKFKKTLNRVFHTHTYTYMQSLGIKKCVDCGHSVDIINIVKHQR